MLVDALTLPVLGVPRFLCWLAGKLLEAAQQELEQDEGKLQGRLLDLQMRYDLGELSDQEYLEQETAIMERLSALRRVREQG